jgi:hypothetical protein
MLAIAGTATTFSLRLRLHSKSARAAGLRRVVYLHLQEDIALIY